MWCTLNRLNSPEALRAPAAPIGLYIHVPFCGGTKCPYCDFYSVCYSDAAATAYAAAVRRNLRLYGERSGREAVDTVYFGGGTPVLLGEHLTELLAAIREDFTLLPDAEITLEANPAECDVAILRTLREGGFNRVSFGVQSLWDEELRQLGRRHTAEEAVEAVRAASEAGFANISADLMIATPGQTMQSLERTLDGLLSLPVTHVSGYLLKVEEGTPFHRQRIWEQLPDEDTQAEAYLRVVERLSRAGFRQYEISNFAKPGLECRHNLRYWRCEDYLGIGPAAHSLYGGKRFAVAPDLAAFMGASEQQVSVTDDAPLSFSERLMLALRLNEGVDLATLCGEEGRDPAPLLAKSRTMARGGLLTMEDARIALTPQGMLVSNEVITQLLV